MGHHLYISQNTWVKASDLQFTELQSFNSDPNRELIVKEIIADLDGWDFGVWFAEQGYDDEGELDFDDLIKILKKHSKITKTNNTKEIDYIKSSKDDLDSGKVFFTYICEF
jgi:hypothetical protein